MGVCAMHRDELAALIGSQVKLSRKGKVWVGLCPFHHEKTPSFNVVESKDGKGRFTCYGCGAWGDERDWLMRTVGLDEVLRRLKGWRPDPNLVAERKEQEQRGRAINAYRDRNPDCSLPDWVIDV